MKAPDFIRCIPKCDKCGGQLALEELLIDFHGCQYALKTSCITCDEDMIIALGLDDFIRLDIRRFLPPNIHLLGDENGDMN